MKVRDENSDVITKGIFKELKTNNNKVFAYERKLGKKSLITIINRNLANSEEIKVKISGINKKSKISFIEKDYSEKLVKSTFSAKLKPAEIIIFTIN